MKIIFLKTSHSRPVRAPFRAWMVALLASCVGLATAAARSSAESADRASPSTKADRADSSSGPTGGSDPTVRGSELTDPRGSPDPTRAANPRKSLKRSDRRFITKAAENTQKEIALAQLAAQRATRPDVRTLSQELVADQQQLSSQLRQLAEEKGVQLEALSQGHMARAGESTNAGGATEPRASRATAASGHTTTQNSTGAVSNKSAAARDSAGGRVETMNTATVPAEIVADRDYRNLARTTGEEFDREYVDLMVDQHELAVLLFQKHAKEAQDPDVREFAREQVGKLQTHLDRAKNLLESAAE